MAGLAIPLLDMTEIKSERLWETESIFIVSCISYPVILALRFLLWDLEYFEFNIGAFIIICGLSTYSFGKCIEEQLHNGRQWEHE